MFDVPAAATNAVVTLFTRQTDRTRPKGKCLWCANALSERRYRDMRPHKPAFVLHLPNRSIPMSLGRVEKTPMERTFFRSWADQTDKFVYPGTWEGNGETRSFLKHTHGAIYTHLLAWVTCGTSGTVAFCDSSISQWIQARLAESPKQGFLALFVISSNNARAASEATR